MRRATSFALLVLVACFPSAPLPSGGLPSATLLLLDVRDPSEPSSVSALVVDLTAVADRTALAAAPRGTFALLFEASVDALALPLGPTTHDPLGESGIPVATATYRLEEEWEESASDLPPALTRYRLPGSFPSRCAQRLGCIAAVTDTLCTAPCPDPPTPAAPLRPVLPELLPCLQGWVERRDLTPARCEPRSCAEGECPGNVLDLPSGPVDLDSSCPPDGDDWSTSLPEGVPIVFVRAGASGVAGTRADPIGSLSAAVTRVQGGGIIAVAKGSYGAPVILPPGIQLIGACPKETLLEAWIGVTGSTTIAASTLFQPLKVYSPGAHLVVREAVLSGDATLQAEKSAHASLLRAQVLAGPLELTADGPGTRLTIEDCFVQRRARSTDGAALEVVNARFLSRGSAQLATDAGTLSVRRSVLDGAVLVVNKQATADVEDVVATNGVESFQLSQGALRLRRVWIDRARRAAIRLSPPDGRLGDVMSADISDLLISEVGPEAGTYERAISLDAPRAELTLSRAWIEGALGGGIATTGTATLTDVWVRGQENVAGLEPPPAGVRVQGVFAKLERVVVEDSPGAGLEVARCQVPSPFCGPGSRGTAVTLQDLYLERNQVHGLKLGKGTNTTGHRLALRQNGAAAFFAQLDDASCRMTDLTIEEPTYVGGACEDGDACSPAGLAVAGTPAAPGDGCTVSRFKVEGGPSTPAGSTGVLIQGRPNLRLEDGLIADFPRGAVAVDRQFPLAQLLLRVRFVDNEVALSRGD